MDAEELYSGLALNIEALVSKSGKNYFEEDFFDTIEGRHKKKVVQFLDKISDYEALQNTDAYREIGNVVRLKKGKQVRMYGFEYGEDRLILTNGGLKKGEAEQQRRIEKAENRRARFIQTQEEE